MSNYGSIYPGGGGGGGASGTGWLVSDDTLGNYGHGVSALNAIGAGANRNVAIGYEAGKSISTGDYNVFIGDMAGDAVNSGSYSVGIGRNALGDGTATTRCVAIGAQAGVKAAGADNVFLGYQAGDSWSLYDGTVIIGRSADTAGGGATEADNVVVIGNNAKGVQEGVSVGASTLLLASNIAAGTIAIGYNAGVGATTVTDGIVIGRSAAFESNTDNYQIAIGVGSSVYPIRGYMGAVSDVDMSGQSLTISGPSALPSASTNLDAGDLILQGGIAATTGIGIGGDAILRGGASGDTGTGGKAIVADSDDNTKQIVFDASGITTATQRTLTMPDADVDLGGLGWDVDDASGNLGQGTSALAGLTSGLRNIAIGDGAIDVNGSGSGNIGIGTNAGSQLVSQSSSIYIGDYAGDGAGIGGDNQVVIGANAVKGAQNANSLVAIGAEVLENVGQFGAAQSAVLIGAGCAGDATGLTGATAVGSGSLNSCSGGSYNVAIGYVAASNLTTADNCIAILSGTSGNMTSATADDQIIIGNGSASSRVPFIDGFLCASADVDWSAKTTTVTGPSALPTASTNLDAGDLILRGGSAATTGAGVGGNLKLQGGVKGSAGTEGDIEVGTAATSKIGFYAATPVAQQSGTGETTGFTAGAGTAVNDDSTFTGNVGATAYRINDLVKAMKNYGLLAQ